MSRRQLQQFDESEVVREPASLGGRRLWEGMFQETKVKGQRAVVHVR